MLISLTAAVLLMSVAEQDGVISTAPRTAVALPSAESPVIEAASPSTTVGSATPHGLSTADQISNWIGQSRSERAASDLPWASPAEEAGPRKPRGEISAGIGTGGYRDFSAAVQLPIGENGTLNLAVRQSKNDPYVFDPYYGRGGGWGLHDGFRSPYGPMSFGRGYDDLFLNGRSDWTRERLDADPYARPSEGRSTSLSFGYSSSSGDR